MPKPDKIIAAITIGDINGIGPEVIIKSFKDEKLFALCTPVIYGSSQVLEFYKEALGYMNFEFQIITDASEALENVVNVVQCWDEEAEVKPGEATELGGKCALLSLDSAIQALHDNCADILITAPVNKHNIQSEQFNVSGHTEYLKRKFNGDNIIMLMCTEELKVGVVTGHIPLRRVSDSINAELIVQRLKVFSDSLRNDFGIPNPVIAVLGLNPHAGDSGLLGSEEEEIIIPAIAEANKAGIQAQGPFSADGLFGSNSLKLYDGILAMYHDQGLVPFKALAFDSGVNFTAGLSVVRTSPDHGVAYDIAGKNLASEESFVNALCMACNIHRARSAE